MRFVLIPLGSAALLLAVAGCGASESGRPAPDGLTAARLRVLEPALQHPTPAMRRKTVAAVGAQGPSAGDLLLQGLVRERDPSVRQQYVYELRDTPGPDVPRALLALAGDAAEATGVRLAAVQALAAQGAAAELVRLAGGDAEIARAARLALMVAGGEPALDYFRAAALRPGARPALRRELVHGLCRVAVPADLDVLRAFTTDPDLVIRRSAARALGRLGDPGDRSRLATLAARDRERSVRRAARIALFRCNSH